jgi:CubicO group peptidase (beta-lactamase class C family)
MKLNRFRRLSIVLGVAVLAAGVMTAARQATTVSRESEVDRVFARWTESTPGCAVGVGVGGRSVLEKAYGMADLEHDVRNTADSIFEAGSVSKQFTAAAMLILATEGKLSLEDPVRKYVPELPDYGSSASARESSSASSGETSPKPLRGEGGPLLIRHMLNHMSGLRDWGSIEAIAGWPRTTRVYTHAHVLDILSRQKALNFTPGAQYSYSNSGYNLAAIIVSRVSGKPFAEFSQERIFKPLGMTHTQWRDDFTRVVKNRAIAYTTQASGYAQEMPFENVHGNGGLLTTVGDLLRWNENFVTPTLGDAAFVARQQQVGVFNDGKPGTYALGLVVDTYKGVREVGHSGSTAGYRAHLVRYPDQHLSVAVLCNVSSGTATQYAHAVADLYLGSAIKTAPTAAPTPRPRPEETFHPTPADLQAFAGTYTSDEAETTLVVKADGDGLVVTRRPDTTIKLRPTVANTFNAPSLGTVTFRRDAVGRVNELSVSVDRVFDLRFSRAH